MHTYISFDEGETIKRNFYKKIILCNKKTDRHKDKAKRLYNDTTFVILIVADDYCKKKHYAPLYNLHCKCYSSYLCVIIAFFSSLFAVMSYFCSK